MDIFLIILFSVFMFGLFAVPMLLLNLSAKREVTRRAKIDCDFQTFAAQLNLVQSGLTNNDDYRFFYDAFLLSGDDPIWQTTTLPKMYLNPYRPRAAELILKGNYDMPWIRLEAKHNQTRIRRHPGNEPAMMALELEGNFGDYFTVRCTAGQNIVALQILGPDIMQQMIDNQQFYDIEIKGAAIMIATDHTAAWSAPFVQQLLAHATTLDGLARATRRVIDPDV